MKRINLTARLTPLPMLKVLAPFAVGIVAAAWFVLPPWFLAVAFAGAGAAALLLRSPLYTLCMLFVAGFGAAQLHRQDSALPVGTFTAFEVTVSDIPAGRGRYYAAEGLVTSWRDPASGQWLAAWEKIVLRTDSASAPCAGERIRCRGTLRPFDGAESYHSLMRRRGFAGSLWITGRNILDRSPGHYSDLHTAAAERLAKLRMEPGAGAVVRAMTAGDTSGVTPELRAAYSRSGMAHLLAVSGLHVGIVFVLINLALWWLPLLRRGHLARNIVAAGCIWLFTAAAGFPASAVRAAVMFSMLQFALASTSAYVAGNVLAAAAFGMLAWNPGYLFDISFQLSFVAVAAILAWGIPLCRWTRTRSRVANYLTDGIAVSLAASLATAPLVSHTFGIAPLAGIVASPAAIALSGVVILGGVLWLLLPVAWLAPGFETAVGGTAQLLNALAGRVAAIPGGAIEYTLSTSQTVGIYLFFVVATAFAWSFESKKSVHLPQ